MRTIDEYMKLPYRMELIPDQDEGGYTVVFPELNGCLTCADTMEQAMINAEDAKRAWLLATLEEGRPVPEPDALKDYGYIELIIPKSLHKRLEKQAERDGVSLKQYCVYLLNHNLTVEEMAGGTEAS